jgi:hypothetical protein
LIFGIEKEEFMRRGMFSGLLVAAVSVGAILGGSASASAAGPRQNWVVDAATATIRNAGSGGCFTGTGPGRPTISQACTGGAAQRFAVQGLQIRNLASGLCLTQIAPSNPTIMQTCTDSPAQQFMVLGQAIRNRLSGLCLMETWPGTATVLERCEV